MSEEFDTPKSRVEAILQNILGAENVLPPPQSRIEYYLQKILEEGISSLPDVTAADNGDILSVIDGLWNKSALKTINNQSLIGSGNINTTPMMEITWGNLKSLRDSNGLIQGMFYRIIDYVTKITGTYDLSAIGAQGYLHWGKSAEHPFDIIVQAVDDHTLSENARAALHSGDTYFQGADIDAWELKYCLDNDAKAPDGIYPRFGFADTVNGKGVIYWMKDEWNNQAGYDFKNVQFIRYALKLADVQGSYRPSSTGLEYNPASDLYNRYGSFYHIFTALQSYMDAGTYVNPFKQKAVVDGIVTDVNNYDFYVGSNILGTIQFPVVDASYLTSFNADWYYTFDYYDVNNSVHYDASFNQFSRVPCRENYLEIETDPVMALLVPNFTVIGIGSNTWETSSVFVSYLPNNNWASCSGNNLGMHSWANTFGNNCYSNTFGNSCYRNTFGDNCNSNTFGYNCYSNTFGYNCNSNTFGYNCNSNTFGYNCNSNTFGNSCYSNTFGDSCDSNTFGNSCDSNTFGDNCDSNTFGTYNQINQLQGIFRYITAGDGVQQVTFPSSMQDFQYMKEIYNYTPTVVQKATFITHTGYNQTTAVSTTDGGTTWS